MRKYYFLAILGILPLGHFAFADPAETKPDTSIEANIEPGPDAPTDKKPDPGYLALQQQLAAMQQKIDKLSAEVAENNKAPEGKNFKYVMSNSVIQLYGHLDVSFDMMSKGISGRTITASDPSNPTPGQGYTAAGNGGWMQDISSNLSFFGIRGTHKIGEDLKAVFQVETQLDVTATPGTGDNNASADNGVKGAFASRNSYLGISGSKWGSIKVGKTDTPYKLATAKMDPFSATVGDYNSIMGNTGGDNRAEFDMRLSHAIWYESPNLNGLTLNILFSPGQNRGFDSSGIAGGEPSCTGGNNPANGGALCGDGSFGDAWSISAAYVNGASLSTLAVEGHRSVNRTTDEITFGGGAPAGATGTSDEWAVKGGLQYTVASKTTLSFIVENIIRYAPDPQYNERSRMGWWLAATQKLNDSDNFNIGWGHAGKTPGDPGDPAIIDPDGTTSGSAEPNEANMYAMSIQHTFKDKKTTIYFVYAMMKNQDGAHYDLGASGHGLMTDCHDGALPAGGFSGGGGICFTGATLQAASVGLTHDF